MKLATVKLDRQVKVGREFSDEWDSRNITLSYDKDTDMVRIGDDGDEVPRSAVVQWARDRSKEPPQVKAQCPQCSREFNNRQALGGHLRQAHGKPAA